MQRIFCLYQALTFIKLSSLNKWTDLLKRVFKTAKICKTFLKLPKSVTFSNFKHLLMT